jgi:hypothetical protein
VILAASTSIANGLPIIAGSEFETSALAIADASCRAQIIAEKVLAGYEPDGPCFEITTAE